MNDSTPTRKSLSNENSSPCFFKAIGSNSNLNRQKSISITSINSNASDNSSSSSNSDSPYQNFLIKRVSNKSGLFKKSLPKINQSPDDYNILATNANNKSDSPIESFRKLNLRGTNLFQDRTNISNDLNKKQSSKTPIFNLNDCPQEIENEDKENIYQHHNHHHFSSNAEQQKMIKHSLEIEAKCRNLIGDRSCELVLPILCSNIKHPDLNCISPETVFINFIQIDIQ